MTVKVVYNTCFGGFRLSRKAVEWLAERGVAAAIHALEGVSVNDDPYISSRDLPRHHPLLVLCVETLGDAANTRHSKLGVEELRGRKYRIEEYDGSETVMEPALSAVRVNASIRWFCTKLEIVVSPGFRMSVASVIVDAPPPPTVAVAPMTGAP